MFHKLFLILLFCTSFIPTIIFAAPYFEPTHPFPTANQSQNTCYFNSANIAVEAKYGTKIRMKKALQMIDFNGTSLATWEYKKRFSDLTHITIHEYSSKKDLIKLLDQWEPVLVSTEIKLKSWKMIRHVSVAYSYDDDRIWVSDPLGGKRKRIGWGEVFQKNGKVRFYNLRTISIKPYAQWNENSKNREEKEDIWLDEKRIKETK